MVLPEPTPDMTPDGASAGSEPSAARPPVNPSEGPWLIRSHYWGSWHVNRNGSACGYTRDLERAGIFGRDLATAYHDLFQDGRDEAIPAARVLADMEAEHATKQAECDAFAEKIARLRAAIADAAPQARTADPRQTEPREAS